MIASYDKLVPHRTKSVNLMHFVVRSAIVLARIGLYILPKADPFPTLCIHRRSDFFIVDKLTDVMRFVLLSLLRTQQSRSKLASDKSNVVKFLARNIVVAIMALFPPYPWSPK